jgi:ATP-dependent Clp protease ATP-binding subunit ClpB
MADEIINRIDSIEFFEPINHKTANEISKLLIKNLSKQINETHPNLTIKLNDPAMHLIADSAIQQDDRFSMGARPLKRFIQKNIKSEVAQLILSGKIEDKKPQTLLVTVKREKTPEEYKNKYGIHKNLLDFSVINNKSKTISEEEA